MRKLSCVVWDSSLPCSSVPAVHRDRPVLSELLLGFVHLADEVDEALSRFWHALLGPVCKLELTYSSRLAILERQEEEGLCEWVRFQQFHLKHFQKDSVISRPGDCLVEISY